MRKRGETKVVQKWCSVCGTLLGETSAGLACANGHGAASENDWVQDRDAAKDLFLAWAQRGKPGLPSEPGAELKEEIERHERPAHHFPRANPGGENALSAPFARIVEKVFVENPEAIYDLLEKQLRIGEKRTDHGTLMKALDEAEDNARWAHRLWVTGKIERDRWELDNAGTWGAMREEANGALQREKDNKSRSKAITDADVEGMAAVMYPEQYAAQQVKRRRTEMMVRSLENLSEMWQSRCRSLNAMLSKNR
jgi:hypothetical protein